MGIKRADFAGSWYPGIKKECIKTIEEYLEGVPETAAEYKGCGGIVPHAGWFFSGRTALAVFHNIKRKKHPEVFFLFGMHLPPGGPHYLFVDDGLETPLGNLTVNREATQMLRDSFSFIEENASSYNRDNTRELQLPMLKYFFPTTTVVSAGISPGETAVKIGERAAEITQTLDLDACFIGSTDLTHYGPNYGFTPQGIGRRSVEWVKNTNDRQVIDAFLSADPYEVIQQAMSNQNACCPGGAAAAIAGVRRMGIPKGTLVQYTTSYDMHPDSSWFSLFTLSLIFIQSVPFSIPHLTSSLP